MLPVTPRGFKDVLPQEARWRERITTDVSRTLALWGYAPIETPTLEVLDVIKMGGELGSTPFHLFDADGQLLVLRPDVTLPIARMVASRLSSIDGPLRFRYVQPVFREQESLRGQARESTQIGIESINLSGPAADAEVLLLMADALKACCLEDFTIAICTVGVLRELLEACVRNFDMSEDWRKAMLDACHASNVVAVNQLASSQGLTPQYQQALRSLPALIGSGEAIAACKQLVYPLGCTDGLDDLAQTWQIIEAAGAANCLRVDFSVMSGFDYYTGLVFEAYAPGLGLPLGSGGRYDHMLQAYGTSAPAAGFAFSLERVMQALVAQGSMPEDAPNTAAKTVLITTKDPARAFIEAAALRAQGTRTVLEHL